MITIKRSIAAVAATFIVTVSLSAQDVQYKSTSSVEFGGPLGSIMKMAAKIGGSSGEMVQTTYLKDLKMRSDMEKSSSIIDLDAGKIININHGKKEYAEMTFAEMQAMMAKAAPQSQQKSSSNMETKIDVDVDDGEKGDVNGVSAQRYFVTTTITVTPTEEARKKGEVGGQMVMLYDMWLTKDGQYRATHNFNKAWAEKMGGMGERSLAILFGQYPQAQEGLKKAAEKMKDMDGAPAKTTMYFVALPEGMKFDRDKLLNAPAEPAKKKGGFGSMLKAAAANAAGANTGNSGDSNKPAQQPEQALLFKSVMNISDVKTTSIDASMFAPPAGYKQVKP